jgi:glyoxalase family protein
VEEAIKGLHHVTATVDDAQADLDFNRKALGLRLVKKTVNFDNHHVYHFYYGTEQGAPGTIWTTFPYRGWGVPPGSRGSGQIAVTSLSVPPGSLDFWKERLRGQGWSVEDVPPRFGEESIAVQDPSGLVLELIASERDRRAPWSAGAVPPALAVRGLHSVTMVIPSPARTLELLSGALGFRVVNEMEGRLRLGVGGDEAGRLIEIIPEPGDRPGRNGLGTVHHVALAVADAEDQLRLRGELLRLGFQITEVRDRCYFTSVYFREPGGVLLELATLQPGFSIDEAPAALGQELKLPPWEEPNRKSIEAALPRVS